MPTSTVPYCTTVSHLTGSTTNVANSNVEQMCENAVINSTPAIGVGISQNIPQNISQNVCQSIPHIAPKADASPQFVTLCCVTSTQAQPIQQPVTQQPQPQAQTFVVQSQSVPTVVV